MFFCLFLFFVVCFLFLFFVFWCGGFCGALSGDFSNTLADFMDHLN